MSDSLTLRLDLIPLTVGITLLSISIALGVVLLRKADKTPGTEMDLGMTLRLTLVVALALIGALFLFLGLYE